VSDYVGPTDGDVFGRIITTENVEDAYVATIGLWIDTYLSEVERQNSLTVPTIGRPQSYQQTFDTNNWPLTQMPAIIVVCRGSTGKMERQGNQQYGCWFEVGVAALVSGQSTIDARRTAQRYQGALNALLLQQGDLHNFATWTVLTDFSVDLQTTDNRYLALAVSEFQTWVDGIAIASYGPPVPSDPTVLEPGGESGQSTEGVYSGYPESATADVELTADQLD